MQEKTPEMPRELGVITITELHRHGLVSLEIASDALNDPSPRKAWTDTVFLFIVVAGVSRTEFVNRPELAKLLAAAEAKTSSAREWSSKTFTITTSRSDRLEVLEGVEAPTTRVSWDDIEATLRAEVSALSAALTGDVTGARQALQSLLVGDVMFRSVSDGLRKAKGTAWELRGNLRFPGGALLFATPIGPGQSGEFQLLVAA